MKFVFHPKAIIQVHLVLLIEYFSK